MPPARDYKRLLPGDRGPNTGGMGGYTRPAYADADLLDEVERRILRPTIDGMGTEGNPYRGVLYAGLMLTPSGPKVLEFNCRFGDPECQLILPLLDADLSEICQSVTEAKLEAAAVRWRRGRTFGIVLAAPGYPEAPQTGDAIDGLDDLPEDVLIFHAGTRLGPDGSTRTAGGRVLTVVGEQRETVLAAADAIRFAGKQHRADVGLEVPMPTGAAAR